MLLTIDKVNFINTSILKYKHQGKLGSKKVIFYPIHLQRDLERQLIVSIFKTLPNSHY